jgi:hypothetical protein
MSHDNHKPSGAMTLVEKIDGPDFGKRTVNELLASAVHAQLTGMGNALEADFIFASSAGEFRAHFHLCLNPVDGRPVDADHVKH